METTAIIEQAWQAFAPPPALSGSEWADEYRVVASGPYPGRWKTERTPQLKIPLNCAISPAVEGVVIVKPTRIGGTEIINNAIGYFIHYDPCDVMYVQSSLDTARKYESRILMPMIISTLVLRERVSTRVAGRKAVSTRISKTFQGGTLDLVGAKSPHSFTMLSKRVVVLDDVNKYERIKSGDPIELAIGRTKDFWNKKIILVSNPGVDGECPIQPYFERTDQRHRYVPCPRCGKYQVLTFGGKDVDFGLKWDDAGNVWYRCEHCHGRINEAEKVEMDTLGEWRPHAVAQADRWVGFKLNPFLCGWHSWRVEIVDRFLAAKSRPDKLKTFVTERLGEWWTPYKAETDTDTLMARREEYRAEVPNGTLTITIGVDVQADRLVAEAVGYGRDFETWSIEKKIIYGNPIEDGAWEDLDRFLCKSWKHESGMQMGATRAFIDSGDGNLTQRVYDFCTTREVRGIFASKGENRQGQAVFSRQTLVNNKQTKLMFAGTDSAKDLIYAWLALEQSGPGYMHFPFAVEEADFNELTSEFKDDRGRWRLKTGRRNEGLDVRVYSLAAMFSLKPDWDELENNIGIDNYAYKVFPAYDPAKHLDLKSGVDARRPVIVCVSFIPDPCVWLLAQTDGKTVTVLDEIVLRGADVGRMAAEVRKRLKTYAGTEAVSATPSGPIIYGPEGTRSDWSRLAEMDLRNHRIARRTDVKGRMNAIAHLLEGPTGEVRLTIHPRCVMLRKDFERVAWKEDGSDLDRASGRGYAVDTLGYFVEQDFPLRAAGPNPARRLWK